MCGIVGYIGERGALDVVVEGLRRLEYRGYDSAGVALIDSDGLHVIKKAGRIENLDKELATNAWLGSTGTVGIGHTRWATHGAPNDRNAHPHTDSTGRVAVIHNGIIENFAELKGELEADGVTFASETDTEVVAHLIGREVIGGATLADALRSVCSRLEGAFTLVVLDRDQPDTIAAARRNSPLVVGVGDGEMFLGSDVAAFIEFTRDAVELGQDQVVEIDRNGYTITCFDGTPAAGRPFRITWDLAAAEKGGYEYFMLKEIDEQPTAAADTLLGHFVDGQIVLDEQRLDPRELREIDKVFVVACGTSYHAGLLAKQAIEHWTRVPVEVEMASEFRYRDPVLDKQTLVVAISQSGETADTLEAVRHARDQQAKVLAICNTNGSQIPRESDAVLYTHSGPEIGVAATKTFIAQLVAVELLGLALAQARGTKFADEIAAEYEALMTVPDLITQHAVDDGRCRRSRARDLGFAGGPVPRPPRRLPGGPRGGAEAEGTRLHARRGVPGRRAQARSDRADRGRAAGGRGHALARRTAGAAPEDAEQHRRDQRPGRAHDHRRRGGGRRGAARPPRTSSPCRPRRRCCRPSSPRSRCRSWPPRSPGLGAWTSTSPAIWRSQ